MDLVTQVELKNSQLLLKRIELQQGLDARAHTPYFKSFLITFVVAPFVLGVIARTTIKPISIFSLPFYRTFLRGFLAGRNFFNPD